MNGLEILVRQAKDGDKEALEGIVRQIQDRVYNLAVRMLGDPVDAEDAAQEILVKVITRLETFREESAFTTWVYSVAARHLMDVRKTRFEHSVRTMEYMEELAALPIDEKWPRQFNPAERALLVEEVRISCLLALLVWLDRPHRLAYVLGDVFRVTGEQGGAIMDITPEAFRQRLSRARASLGRFMSDYCSLIRQDNPCECARQASRQLSEGIIDLNDLKFAGKPCAARHDPTILEKLHQMDELIRVAVLFRTHPDYAAPDDFASGVRELLESGRFDFFE